MLTILSFLKKVHYKGLKIIFVHIFYSRGKFLSLSWNFIECNLIAGQDCLQTNIFKNHFINFLCINVEIDQFLRIYKIEDSQRNPR
jgi:ABC-type uncharacterized transport system permease subunit